MFRAARYLKFPLSPPVTQHRRQSEFPVFNLFLLRAVNGCQKGSFTALLSAGIRTGLSPQQQCRASSAACQCSPSSHSGRNLEQQSQIQGRDCGLNALQQTPGFGP